MFIFIYMGTSNSNFILIVFAINVFTICKGNYKMIFSQLFFLLPFSMIYKTGPGTTSLFTYGMFLTGIFVFIRGKRMPGALIFMLIFFFSYIASTISSSFSSFYRILSGILCLIVFVQNVKISDIRDIIISSSLGIIGSSYMGLLKMSNSSIQKYFTEFNSEWINGEQFYRFSGLFPDPNYYSISVIITLFMVLVLLHAKSLNKILGFGLISVMVYFGSRSYSRIFTICIVVFALYFMYYYMKNTKYKFIGYCIGIVILYFGILQLQETTFYENMYARFQEDDITNGRTNITRAYLDVILNDQSILFKGKGLDGGLVKFMGAHNTYIEILYFIGIFGSILFLFLLLSIFRLRGKFTQGLNKYNLLLVFIIGIGSLGYFTHSDLYFYLMFVWANMYFGTKEIEKSYAKIEKSYA